MRRILISGVVLTMITAFFFGCGGSGTPLPSKNVKSAQIIFSAMTTVTPLGFIPVLANISSVRLPDSVSFNVNSAGEIIDSSYGVSTAKFDVTRHIMNFAYANTPLVDFGQIAVFTMNLSDNTLTADSLTNSLAQLNNGKRFEFTGGFNAISSAQVPVRIEVRMN